MPKIDLKIGDSVIVNPGVLDVDEGFDIGGWQGRVSQISAKHNTVCVKWDSQTLNSMPGEAIDRWEEEGLDWGEYCLDINEVSAAQPRDSEEDVEDAIKRLEEQHEWSSLGEEGRRIQAVLDEAEDDDEWSALEAWEDHLQKVLTFPFEAEVSEWQERGPLRTGDKVRVHALEDLDDHYGLLVSLRKGRRKFVFPLCDLKTIDHNSANYQPVKDYAVWFANR